MRLWRSEFRAFAVGVLVSAGLRGQTPAPMSLAEAQRIALHNHPRIASAALVAQAGAFATREVTVGLLPDAIRKRHRCRLGTQFNGVGRSDHHIQHL